VAGPAALGHRNAASDGASEMKTILMFQWFDCSDSIRQGELRQCAEHNLGVGFDKVIIFDDSVEPAFFGVGVEHVPITKRLTFEDFVRVVDDPRHRGDLVVLTNTDIMLDPALLRAREVIRADDFLCFSRYEANGQIASAPWCTQDVWAMIAQPIHTSIMVQSTMPLGLPGCEIRFSELLFNAGFLVANPSLDIRNTHIHSNKLAHKDENRIYGAYLFTPPCRLADLADRKSIPQPSPVYLARFINNRVYQIPLS
jgi:hypothetical protein